MGLIRRIREVGGPAALDEVVAQADNNLVRVTFAAPISAHAWIHYSAFASFLVSTDRILGSGDTTYCRDLGRHAGQRDLNSVFKLILRMRDPQKLITSCSDVWASYYRDAGHMEAISTAPERTVLRIFDFPKMHPCHCQLMIGWMEQAMELIGCKVSDDARESHCQSRGDVYHEFVCSWRRA